MSNLSIMQSPCPIVMTSPFLFASSRGCEFLCPKSAGHVDTFSPFLSTPAFCKSDESCKFHRSSRTAAYIDLFHLVCRLGFSFAVHHAHHPTRRSPACLLGHFFVTLHHTQPAQHSCVQMLAQIHASPHKLINNNANHSANQPAVNVQPYRSCLWKVLSQIRQKSATAVDQLI